MHLSKDVLKQYILNNNILTGYSDLDKQLTANGIDVQLAAVIEILNGGKLAINKTDNKEPQLGTAHILKGYEDRLKGYAVKEIHVHEKATIVLKKHQPYFVLTCESVSIPTNLMIDITPRSSLFRLTQSLLGCSFCEAGYQGFLCFMLLPFLNSEVELGARIAQLSFSQLTGHGNYEEQKETNYQGGKIF